MPARSYLTFDSTSITPDSIHLIQLIVAGLLCLAALHDIATRTVPNWVSIAILVAGLMLQVIDGTPLIAGSLSIAVFVVAALMCQRGWLGGADVKLIAALALTVSPRSVGVLILSVSLAGGLLAMVYLVLFTTAKRPLHGRRTGFVARVLKAERWRIHKRWPLPYAAAIALGGLFTIFAR